MFDRPETAIGRFLRGKTTAGGMTIQLTNRERFASKPVEGVAQLD